MAIWRAKQEERIRGTWEYFFFQAEDGIQDLVRSRGLGDVYEGQKISTPGQQ